MNVAVPTFVDEDDTPLNELRECHDCGLRQRLPALRPGHVAHCPRCDAVLRRRRRNSFSTTAALMCAGLLLLAVIAYEPLIGISVLGRPIDTTVPVMPFALDQFGMGEIAILVLTFTFIAPILRLGTTAGVLLGLKLPHGNPRSLAALARIRAWVKPWAMTEVFLLGLFVAYTRLTAYSTVRLGPALYALAALMLVTVASDAWLDEHALWDAIGRRQPPAPDRPGRPIGCDTCGHLSVGRPRDPCPTCESRLRLRKPEPVTRCWALVAAAAALYVPANILPVLTLVKLHRSYTSTILGGVQELIAAQMWPLAAIVFVASVAVPIVKLVLLAFLLISTQRRSGSHLRRRTKIYRFVEIIGRWSMIDVFMIAILTALVRVGALASAIPEPGIVCFAGVVILTMLAAASFDPRAMWDAADENADVESDAPVAAAATAPELAGARA